MLTLKRKAGFTLIELLIVIAIIGILAAVAISQYSAYVERAGMAQEDRVLSNFVHTIEGFYISNDKYPVDYKAVIAAGFRDEPDITVTYTTSNNYQDYSITVKSKYNHKIGRTYDSTAGLHDRP